MIRKPEGLIQAIVFRVGKSGRGERNELQEILKSRAILIGSLARVFG